MHNNEGAVRGWAVLKHTNPSLGGMKYPQKTLILTLAVEKV